MQKKEVQKIFLEISKQLDVLTIHLKYQKMEMHICGKFLYMKNTIILNSNWLRLAKDMEIFVVIAHELRHAYQFKNKMYINEFLTYQENLLYQYDMEIDAIAYCVIMVKKYFNLNVIIPNEILEKVNLRMKKIT